MISRSKISNLLIRKGESAKKFGEITILLPQTLNQNLAIYEQTVAQIGLSQTYRVTGRVF